MKLVCNDPKLTAVDIGYSIVDAVFEREVFLHISWKGRSKDKSTSKLAFQPLEYIQKLFLHLIRTVHPDYPATQLLIFFSRRIISNAKNRATNKGLRVSRHKNRKRRKNLSETNADEEQFSDDAPDGDEEPVLNETKSGIEAADENVNIDDDSVDYKTDTTGENSGTAVVNSEKRAYEREPDSIAKRRKATQLAASSLLAPHTDDSSDESATEELRHESDIGISDGNG